MECLVRLARRARSASFPTRSEPQSASRALQERFQVYSAQTALQIATLALQANTRTVKARGIANRALLVLIPAQLLQYLPRSVHHAILERFQA